VYLPCSGSCRPSAFEFLNFGFFPLLEPCPVLLRLGLGGHCALVDGDRAGAEKERSPLLRADDLAVGFWSRPQPRRFAVTVWSFPFRRATEPCRCGSREPAKAPLSMSGQVRPCLGDFRRLRSQPIRRRHARCQFPEPAKANAQGHERDQMIAEVRRREGCRRGAAHPGRGPGERRSSVVPCRVRSTVVRPTLKCAGGEKEPR